MDVRLRGFARVTGVSEALDIFLRELNPKVLESELVPLRDALNRVLAVDIKAEMDLPPFNRSTVDGYAVRAQDTLGASETSPIRLKIAEKQVSCGQACRIWTGMPLPPGADAVIMLEYAKERGEFAEICRPAAPGDNVSPKGETAKKGEIVLHEGRILRPDDIALLACLGIEQVSVVRRPRVAVLSVGSELVEVGHPLREGAIFDSNRHMLRCLLEELGCTPVDLGMCPDDESVIKRRILEGVKAADVVVTTGGVSVGVFDLVPEVVRSVGRPGVLVHGVAMRPAKPTALGIIRGKPIVMLSGNPVAAFLAFETFVRPLISKLLGADLSRPVVKAKLVEAVSSQVGLRSFLRVRVFKRDGELFAQPIRITGAGVLTTLTKANGYVEIPEDRPFIEEGEMVDVKMIGRIESES